jgi:hypothetical protein
LTPASIRKPVSASRDEFLAGDRPIFSKGKNFNIKC